MKRLLIAAAAGVAIAAGAQAADVTRPTLSRAPSYALLLSGDFSVAWQHTSWPASDGYWTPESGSGVNGYARLLVPLSGGISAQFDAAYAQNPSLETLDTESLLGVHLSVRDPQHHMLGVLAALGTGGLEDGESFPGHFIGAEGQLYLNNLTFFLQGGYERAHEGGDTSSEVTSLGIVRGGARFFLNPNLKIDGELARASGTFNGYSGSVSSWAVGIEHLFQTAVTPVSLFARYDGTRYNLDACGTKSMTERRFMAGLSIKFGTTDLLMQDRRGANSDFPRFSAWPALDNLEYGCT